MRERATDTNGAFHGNVIDGTSTGMLDIGSGTGSTSTSRTTIGSARMAQLTNADVVLADRPVGVGPR